MMMGLSIPNEEESGEGLGPPDIKKKFFVLNWPCFDAF